MTVTINGSGTIGGLVAGGLPDATVTSVDLASNAVDSQTLSLFNATGSAPVYACRAWVNFNGTGTVAIRASGNVSSITDNGTGDYTVNITNAMPDSNYSIVATSEYSNTRGDSGGNHNVFLSAYAASTTTVNIQTIAGSGTTYYDCQTVSAAVFR